MSTDPDFDLDAALRTAMTALDHERPAADPAFADRVLARLDDDLPALPALDLREPGEPGDLDAIRSLASETRARLASSRRARETLELTPEDPLASSSLSWKSVALPQPAQVIAPAPPAAAAAASTVAMHRPRARWVRPVAGAGLGVARAAGALLVITTRDQAFAPPPPAPDVAPQSAPMPAPAAPAGSAARDGWQAQLVTPSEIAKPTPAPAPAPAPAKRASKPAATKKPSKIAADAPVTIDRADPPAEPAVTKTMTKTNTNTKAAADEPSFDRLLEEAGVTAPPPARPTLGRSSLAADDIKRVMSAVEPRARACFEGTQGTVQLKLSVASTGKVLAVTASGPFAGTPVARCVERAASVAVFPAWDGAAQSFSYSFLLAD
ncbi:MAG TPA: hypothetical protein VFP84_38315 [Kofleriaceae bacterium]|nr:hypothetical protein [Kofleriaceae bacterium]